MDTSLNALATIGGLPLHPLVVHAAVVLLPLSAIALLLVVVVRRWRRGYAWLAVAGTVVGAASVIASKMTGEQLADRIGNPASHAQLGTMLAVVAGALGGAAVLWWVAQFRGRGENRDSLATRVLGIAMGILVVPTLVLTVLTGHSGAEAAWGDRAAAYPAPTVFPTPTASAVPADDDQSDSDSESPAGLSMDDVQQHASAESCWAAIEGKVYDLTEWIGQHPGGTGVIEQLCGADATVAFAAQHGGDDRPVRELENFVIGDLQ